MLLDNNDGHNCVDDGHRMLLEINLSTVGMPISTRSCQGIGEHVKSTVIKK